MRQGPVVLVLMLILSAASAGASCQCDCDGNGRVGVNDLIRLFHVSLGNAPISHCPSYLRDPGDITIRVLISCVNAALSRTTCTPQTPTPTKTRRVPATPSPTDTPVVPPTPPADAEAAVLAAELLQSIAYGVCFTDGTPGGRFEVSSTPSGAYFLCDSFTAHNGNFELAKHPSATVARDLFGAAQPRETETSAGGGTLREARTETGCCPGAITSWRWQRDCWLASGYTFDETHYILTPQGPIVVDALVESGRLDDLLALCPPSP